MNGKFNPTGAQNKLEDLQENLVKPMRYNFISLNRFGLIELILAGKNLVNSQRHDFLIEKLVKIRRYNFVSFERPQIET